MEQALVRIATEETPPQTLQRQRNHRHRRLFENPCHPAAKFVDLAVGGQFAFREDAHQFAVLQILTNARERFFVDLDIFLASGDRNRARRAKDKIQHRQVVDLVVHDKANRPTHCPADQQGVDERNVVAHQQRRALVRDRFKVAMLDAVHGVAEQPDHEAHAEFGDDLEDVGVDADVQQRHHQKQLRNRQLGNTQQNDRNNRRHHHKQRVENVVGGNHPRPLVLSRARLDQRVQRHDIEAAENAQAKDVDQHRPSVHKTQHGNPAMAVDAVRDSPGMPPQQQAKHGQAERAERHQTDLDFAPRELFAEHRTQRNPYREHRQNQRDHGFVAVHPFLGVGRDLRQVDRPDEPEPRVADNRARHRRRLAQTEFQRRPGLAEDVPVQAHFRGRCRCARNAAAGQITQHGNADDRCGDHRRVVLGRHHDPGADGAGENCQKRAHFHQTVAADQFVIAQSLRQDRILHRAEQRRVCAHGEQRHQHQRQMIEEKADRSYGHDGDFREFDQTDQRVLGEFFPELPGQRREQEKRQDKQQRAQIDPDRAVTLDGQPIEDGEDQRLFKYVVVKRAERLGNKEGQKAPGAQQVEL